MADHARVATRLTVTNGADEVMAARGETPAPPRTVTFDEFLVDPGRLPLCLPAEIVHQLGLQLAGTATVFTDNGIGEVGVYEYVTVEIEGRTSTMDCLALPVGKTAILGLTAIQLLGMDLDAENHRLRIMPDSERYNAKSAGFTERG